MRRHSSGNRFTVYDDVLPHAELEDLRAQAALRGVRPTLSPINRFHDEMSFQGSGPSGRVNDAREESVVARFAAQCLSSVVGSHPQDEAAFTYSSTYAVYPAGSQLSWHDDGGSRVGAFIFYLGEWSGDWGGELDVIDCPPEDIPRQGTLAESVVTAPANVTSIFPRPNRLVIVAARTLHRIRRVDALAGSHVRQSVSGFVAKLDEAQVCAS